MKKIDARKIQNLKLRQQAPLITPTDLKAPATKDIAGAMNAILADVFALYLKTKNFHWHMSGPHFRDYHLLLDEQADIPPTWRKWAGSVCTSSNAANGTAYG